jgi:hypothetical protein
MSSTRQSCICPHFPTLCYERRNLVRAHNTIYHRVVQPFPSCSLFVGRAFPVRQVSQNLIHLTAKLDG